MAAYEAWQNDLQNTELADDYFEKLTDFDRNLEQRGTGKGQTIDEEIPLQSLDQSIEQSLGNDGRQR